MSYNRYGPIELVACGAGNTFAQKVAKELFDIIKKENQKDSSISIPTKLIIPISEQRFKNSEFKTSIDDSIRGSDLYIFQDVESSVYPNPEMPYSSDENLRCLTNTIDAARRADAQHITAVIPVFPYARQERRTGRECITAARVAQEIEDAGANRVITMDLHNDAIQGFFRKAVCENLHASKNIIDYIRTVLKLNVYNMVALSMDAGGAKLAEHYANEIGCDLALGYKKRSETELNKIDEFRLAGETKGKRIGLGVDDMADTAGTACEGLEKIKDQTDIEELWFAISLALLNGNAKERFRNLYNQGIIKGVIGTDVVDHGLNFAKENPWFHPVSVAKYHARVIFNLNVGRSISELLK